MGGKFPFSLSLGRTSLHHVRHVVYAPHIWMVVGSAVDWMDGEREREEGEIMQICQQDKASYSSPHLLENWGQK